MFFEFFRQNSIVQNNRVSNFDSDAQNVGQNLSGSFSESKNKKANSDTVRHKYLEAVARHRRLSEEIDKRNA